MPTATISWNAKGFIIAGNNPQILPTWADARNIPDGTVYQTVNFSTALGPQVFPGRGVDNYFLSRTYGWINVSAYPNITQIDLNIPWGTNNGATDFLACQSFAFGLSLNPPFPGTTLQTTDFDIANSWDVNVAYSNPIALAGSSTQTITLNAQAVADANAQTYLNFILIDHPYDYLDVDPFPINGYGNYGADFNYGNNATAVITYGNVGYPNDVNDVTFSDIGEINGIVTADISEVIGV